jgi:predicted transcriptional regulator
MQVLWGDHAGSFTVRDVLDRLNRRRKELLAYTTVQTMLTILKNKGVVTAEPGPRRAHTFRARLSREEVTTSMVSDLVKRLFGGRVRPLLQHLIEHEELSPDEMQELKEWIETRLDDAPEEPQ